jgi:hypothetical protein
MSGKLTRSNRHPEALSAAQLSGLMEEALRAIRANPAKAWAISDTTLLLIDGLRNIGFTSGDPGPLPTEDWPTPEGPPPGKTQR